MTKCHLCNVLHLEFIWQSLMVSVHQWKIPTHNITLHHPNRFVSEVQPSGKPTLVWRYTLARPSLFFKLSSIYQRTIFFRWLIEYGCFEHFHSVNFLLFSSARSRDFDGMLDTGLPVSMYTTKTPIDMCRFNVRSST